MKTILSSKFFAIAAVAAALLTSGTVARAGEVFRANVYFAPRAPIMAPVPVRPVYGYPARPVVVVTGPARSAAPVCAYPAPRPIVPVTVGLTVREGWVGHPYGVWARR